MSFLEINCLHRLGADSRFDKKDRERIKPQQYFITLLPELRWLLLCFWALIPLIGFAQTEVSGNVSGVWDVEHSPYHVIGRLEIPDGETLTLEPGVEMRFIPGEEEYIPQVFISGSLVIRGEEDNPIHILRDPDWHPNNDPQFHDLFQAPSDNPIVLEHAILENVVFWLGGIEGNRLRSIHQINGYLSIDAHELVDAEFEVTQNTFEAPLDGNNNSTRVRVEGYRSALVYNNLIVGEGTSRFVAWQMPIEAHDNILRARFSIFADRGNMIAYDNRSPDGTGALEAGAHRFNSSLVRDNDLSSAGFDYGNEAQLINNSTPEEFEHSGVLNLSYLAQSSVSNCMLNKLDRVHIRHDGEAVVDSSTLSGDLWVDNVTHLTMTDVVFDPVIEPQSHILIDTVQHLDFTNVIFNNIVDHITIIEVDTLEFQSVLFLDSLERSFYNLRDNGILSFQDCEIHSESINGVVSCNNQVLFNNCYLPNTNTIFSFDNDLLEIRNSIFLNWRNTQEDPDRDCQFVCIGNRCSFLESLHTTESIICNNLFISNELRSSTNHRLSIANTHAEVIGNTFFIPTYCVATGIYVGSDVTNESLIQNNLFIGNRDDAIGIYYYREPQIVEDYNCFWNLGTAIMENGRAEDDIIHEPGAHSLVGDPGCRRPELHDYRLRPDSPCIDAGNPEYQDPDDTRADIGAFYFNQNEDQPPAISTNFEQFASQSSEFELLCRAVDDNSVPELIIEGLPDWLERINRDFEANSIQFHGVVPDDQESFSFLMTATDNAGLEDTLTVFVRVQAYTILLDEISGVLNPDESPFFAPYRLTVPANQQLTIPGGCELFFRQSGSREEEDYNGIYVDGVLNIEGTTNNPVVIACIDEFEGIPKYQGIVLNPRATARITGLECLEAYCGVYGISDNSIYVKNSEFVDNLFCIHAYEPDTCLVDSNRIVHNSSGGAVWARSGDYVRIRDNEFIHGGEASGGAISVSSDSAVVSGNRIVNFEGGIYFCNAHVIDISNNWIETEQYGIMSSTRSIGEFSPSVNDSFSISQNTIIGPETGFTLCEYGTPWLIGNEFVDCNIGVDLAGHPFNPVEPVPAFLYNNLASACSIGVYIDHNSLFTGTNNLIVNCEIGIHCDNETAEFNLLNNGFIGNVDALKYSHDPEYPINMYYSGFFDNQAYHYYRQINDEFGILSRVNANGDSCDAAFNLYDDPGLDLERFYYAGGQSIWQHAGQRNDNWQNGDGTTADIGLYGGPYAWQPPLLAPPGNQAAPEQFTLSPIFPNPFNNAVNLSFQTTVPMEIVLKIFDLRGREIKSQTYNKDEPGQHLINVSTAGWASGMYLLSFTGNGTSATPMRMIKVK